MTTGNQGKLRVGIIFGGMSSEREVSLESGRNIFNKINRAKYEPIPIFMDGRGSFWEISLKLLMRNSTRDVEEDLESEGTRIFYEDLKNRVDVVCLGLHGKYGEDGCLQGALELLDIPYTGSGVLASALGLDKYQGRKLLAINGLDVPAAIAVISGDWGEDLNKSALLERVGDELGFPCIVKPAREGCSTAVAKVLTADALSGAIEEALKWDGMALVEEFIAGTEVTCGVIAEEGRPLALIPSETIPSRGILSLEDKFLYGQGENKTPARLPEETLRKIQNTAVKTFLALGLKGYARIDMFVRAGGAITVLEANTLPGLTPSTVLFHQAAAAGITPAGLIDRIIISAISCHAGKKGPL